MKTPFASMICFWSLKIFRRSPMRVIPISAKTSLVISERRGGSIPLSRSSPWYSSALLGTIPTPTNNSLQVLSSRSIIAHGYLPTSSEWPRCCSFATECHSVVIPNSLQSCFVVAATDSTAMNRIARHGIVDEVTIDDTGHSFYPPVISLSSREFYQ